MNLVGRLIKAFGALALTAGIVAGVPVLLLRYVGNPIPKHGGALHGLEGWMSNRFDIHAFNEIVIYLLWAAWAVFVAQLVIQVPGVVADLIRILRHREPRRTDGPGGPGGALARGLIAAFTVALIAPRGASASVVKASAGFVLRPSARSVAVAPAFPGGRIAEDEPHAVVKGDTLWGIAEASLGDPERWHEVFDLNVGRVQDDGEALHVPDLIKPGWKLLLPGDGAQPSGLRAEKSADGSAPIGHEAKAALLANPVPPQAGLAMRDGRVPSEVPSPAAPARLTSGSAPAHVASSPRVAPRDRVAVRLPGGGLVPISLAGAVAAALALARLRARARARIRPIDDAAGDGPPSDPHSTVPELLQGAHQATVCAPGRGVYQDDDDFGDDPYAGYDFQGDLNSFDGLDAAHQEWTLVMGSCALADEPGVAPGLRAVLEATEASPDLHIAERGNVLIPLFSVTTAGLGLTGEGAVDTARSLLAGALAAGGPRVLDQAVELHTTSDVLSMLLTEHEDLPATERLTVFSSQHELLERTVAEVESRSAEVAEYGYATAAEVKRYANLQPFRPRIIVTIPEAAERHRLESVAQAGQAVDTHLVLLGPWGAGTTVAVSGQGSISASGVAAALLDGADAFRINEGQLAQILGVLQRVWEEPTDTEPFTDTADDDGELPPAADDEEPRTEVPHLRPVREVSRVQAAEGVLVINLMGPFAAEVDGRDVTALFSPSHRTLLTYLGLRERPVLRSEITEALWADEDLDPKSVQKRKVRFDSRLYQTKKAMTAAVGSERDFITVDRASGLVGLNRAAVVTDLACFDELIRSAARADEDSAKIEYLEAACALYRGPLDESIRGDWLLEHREDRLRRYRDAAGDLARIVGRTDADRGLSILNRLLEHDLFNEDLYRRIMRGQARLGREDAVRRTFNLLETRFEAADMEVDPSTRELVQGLTRRRAA